VAGEALAHNQHLVATFADGLTVSLSPAQLRTAAHQSANSRRLVWTLPLVHGVVRSSSRGHDVQVILLEEEDRLIGAAVDRLMKDHPDVPEHAVHDIVASVRRQFADARIRDFVPLFVERRTKEELAHLAGATSNPT